MRQWVVAILGLLVWASACADVRPGDPSPDDLGNTLDGQAIHASALRGKVVVISFWATWCTYCLKELPTLVGLQSVATQRGLPMQVVAVDYEQPRDVFRRSVKLLQPKLPGLLMTWDRVGRLRKPFDSGDGIPLMVLLHRDGSVARVMDGYDEGELDDILAQINTLLNEPWSAPASTGSAVHSP
ncbi:MAG: TlpA family protein disulfide reductase [Proteobacteria bacterium]|nr:TlpA family protein disulfide reductase [Pseudomonadota bacterium]